LPQWGLTCLIQVQCFFQSFCLVASLAPLNPPLRQAEKRFCNFGFLVGVANGVEYKRFVSNNCFFYAL